MQIADRISRLGVEGAFAVLQQARALEAQGHNIVHLEIGEPDFPTPQHIVEAGKQALQDGWTHYGPTMGLPDLREAIAKRLVSTHGLTIDPVRIGVMPGAKPALFFAMMAVLEKGDEVIYPDPGFPIYSSMVRFLEAVPKPIPLVASRGFSFDLDRLRDSITGKTRMLILNSPQNPTGGVIPADDIRAIADMVRGRDITVISDEIYATICFGEAPLSIASLDGMNQQTVIVDGFSKSHAMTGWRLGYGIYPDHLVDAVSKLMVNSNSCTASFTQKAGLAAIEGPQDECDAMVAEFRKRRDYFCGVLNTIPGFACETPLGAFYAFPNVTGTGLDSKVLAGRLLREAGVACLSGDAFGTFGTGYLRFSLANSLQNLAIAGDRVREMLGGSTRSI
jgi:aspartate/methionine/tyrosine aminotransferase